MSISAFPWGSPKTVISGVEDGEYGMDLRDYFATHLQLPEGGISPNSAAALMGTAYPQPSTGIVELIRWWAEAEAKYRYLHADMMMKTRKQ